MTRAPGATPDPPGSTTSPATSLPEMCGSGSCTRSSPRRSQRSRWFNAQARTRTIARPGAGGGARDLVGCLEVARIAARQRRPSQLQFRCRDGALAADAADLAERFPQRVGGRLRLYGAVEHERAGRAPEFERRPRAVGISLV